AFNDLFLEGLVVLVIVAGARGACGHQQADAEHDRRQPQGFRRTPHHQTAGSGPAHRCSTHLRQGVLIGRDQGAFAAGTPIKESYNKAMTPATMATSARLNTYQL